MSDFDHNDMAISDEENIRLALKTAVDNYLTAQIVLNSGRMDDMMKLMQLYGDQDSGFSSRLLDSIMHRLRREQWEHSQSEEHYGDLVAADEEK